MAFEPGIFSAIVTPFTAAGELHPPGLTPIMRMHEAAGLDGVVVAGTTGEAAALTSCERRRLLEAAIESRGTLRVLAGTGSCSVADAVELTRHACSCGADALLVIPPFFIKGPSLPGLVGYYRAVLDAATRPVLLYHIPQYTAVPIADELVDQLAGHPMLAGIKDSAGDREATLARIARFPDLAILAGADHLVADVLAAGGAGCISGTSNPVPHLPAEIARCHRAGLDTSVPQALFAAAQQLFVRHGFVPSCKALLREAGYEGMHVRAPQLDLPDDEARHLCAEARALGIVRAAN